MFFNQIQYKTFVVLNNNDYVYRKQLMHVIGVPRTTIYDNLVILESLGFVRREDGFSKGGRGRPKKRWSITKKGRTALTEFRRSLNESTEKENKSQ